MIQCLKILKSQDSQSSEKHKVSQVAFMAIIKSHPIIYDETHPDYKKRIPNRNAWEDVAEQAEQNGKLLPSAFCCRRLIQFIF